MKTAGSASLLLLALAGCPGPSPVTPPDSGPPDQVAADAGSSWQVVFDGTTLDRDVLSAWGTSASDVYAVGGPLGNTGYEALVLHFDGTSWRELPAGGADTFWWVYGSGPSDVWMVGEKGRITHWDGTTFTEPPRVTTGTIYGVWAASPTDAWAVGGTPEGGTTKPNDILLHWDGSAWTPSPLPMTLGRAFFKVWGTSSSDLYVVGEAGTIWHRQGTTWTLLPQVAQGTLFTVFGCSATEVYAVGGRDVLVSDGTSFSKVNVTLLNDVSGVACASPGTVAIDGYGALKERLVAGTWVNESADPPLTDLHAAWADPTGAFWVVGGDFVASAMPNKPRAGVLGRYGAGTVSTVVGK